MTVAIVIVGQEVAPQSRLKKITVINKNTTIASCQVGLRIPQVMVDALVLTGQRRNRKNKDFKKHKNSFCLELGWQAMRQRVYLRTFESARVATIPNQPIYFIEAQETTFQHLLSIFYAIIKDLLWLSCSFLIPTSHWLVSLHLLGTVTLKALLYLIAQPLSTNMTRTGTKLLLA